VADELAQLHRYPEYSASSARKPSALRTCGARMPAAASLAASGTVSRSRKAGGMMPMNAPTKARKRSSTGRSAITVGWLCAQAR